MMSAGSAVKPLIIRLLSATVAAANKAGQIIREVLKSGELGVVQKGVDDPQTEADRKAQRCITASLSLRFPGITIVGEETLPPNEEDLKLVIAEDSKEVLQEQCPPDLAAVQEKEVVVWVDPLDGTKEYTLGFIEDVTVLIGIAVGGKPVGGAIHQPFYSSGSQLGRTVWGLTGLGVRGLTLSPPSQDSLRLVVTRSHSSDIVEQAIKALNPTEVIRAGGSGNKVLHLLDGKADIYVHASMGTKKWDTCATDALLKEAGGYLTDLHGRTLSYEADLSNYYNNQGLVVTRDKGRHEEILAKIPEHIKREFPYK